MGQGYGSANKIEREMMLLEVQKRIKAVAAVVSGFVGQIVLFYQQNQNLTLHDVVVAVAVALGVGVIVHQAPKNK